jgi:hypothetical protein
VLDGRTYVARTRNKSKTISIIIIIEKKNSGDYTVAHGNAWARTVVGERATSTTPDGGFAETRVSSVSGLDRGAPPSRVVRY